MKYIRKNPQPLHIFSLPGFGRKLHHGGPSCFSKQCHLAQVWVHRPSSISETDKPFPRAACAPLPSHLAIKLVFPSGTVAERQAQLPKKAEEFCQEFCPRVLSKLRLFTQRGSCFLTKVCLVLAVMLPKYSKLKSLNGWYYQQEKMIPWKEEILNADILNI